MRKTDAIIDNLLEEPQLVFKFEPTKEVDVSDKTLRVLSLFSGGGGMDLGFEGGFSVLKDSINEEIHSDFIDEEVDNNFVRLKETRFKTVFANDILIPARNAWVHYFSKRGRKIEDYETESIVDLVKLHKNGVKVFPENIDIVTGGFPCQDFSIAGKRKGFDSHRNHKGELLTDSGATEETRGKLYMWMKEVIEITRPKMFIAENVKGLVNLLDVKDIIQKDFENTGEGYIVLPPQVLHSANFGVPQSRERVFFIGLKKSALTEKSLVELSRQNVSEHYSPYPSPTHNFNLNNSKLKDFVTLNKVFDVLDEPEQSIDLSQQSYSKAKFMGRHCQGQIEVKLDGISPTIRAEHHGNIEFRRLSKENGGLNVEELSAGLKERRLTVRECALIQTFPPDFEFVIPNTNGRKNSYLVSPSMAYKIIGNAVPPLLAYNLAKKIEKNWELYFK